MAKPKVVWVVVDPKDPLDLVLFDALDRELANDATLKMIEAHHDDAKGVVEVLRGVLSELGERQGRREANLVEKLQKADVKPDLVVTSSSEEIVAMADLAKRTDLRPIRVAIVRTPSMGTRWERVPADLRCVPDSSFGSFAENRSSSTRVTGVPVEQAYSPITDAPAARLEHDLDADAHVLLITADAFERHELNQLMVQIALAKIELEVLFEVDDEATAAKLRRMAPAHDISASLIPSNLDGASFWSLAHLVIGPAKPHHLFRSRAVHVPMLVSPSQGDQERALGEVIAASGSGRLIKSLSTLAVDLDLTLEPQRYESLSDRLKDLYVKEPAKGLAAVVRVASEGGASLAEEARKLPTGLERISKGKRSEPHLEPDQVDEALKAATEVRDQSETWSQRARIARSHGDEELAIEADKRAARHREVLNRLLETIRPEDWTESGDENAIDEELEALRRRVLPEKSVESRLRSLEVEDELQELKDRLKQE